MTARDIFGHLYQYVPLTDRQEEERALEGLLITFKADPEEAEDLGAALLGRMLEDEFVNYQWQKLKVALQSYHRRNSDPNETDDIEAYKALRSRTEGY